MAGYLIKGKVLFSLLFSKHFTWKNRCRRGLQSQIVHGNQLSHIEKRKKTCLAISLKHNYCTVLNRGSQRFKIKQKLMKLELWIIYNPFLFKIKFILAVSQFNWQQYSLYYIFISLMSWNTFILIYVGGFTAQMVYWAASRHLHLPPPILHEPPFNTETRKQLFLAVNK